MVKVKKQITLDGLVSEMRSGFKEMRKEVRTGFARVDGQIEALALATKHGFDGVDEHFNELENKADVRFKLIIDRFEKSETDIKDIKANLGPLFRMVSMQEEEMDDLCLRLVRVERKVGITK